MNETTTHRKRNMIAKTLHCLADSITALEIADASTNDGFTSDFIQNALVEVYKAVHQSVPPNSTSCEFNSVGTDES